MLSGEKLHNKFLEMSTATMPLTSSHNSKLKTSPLFDSYFTHFDLCEYKIIRQYVHFKKKHVPEFGAFFLFIPGGHLLPQINKHTHRKYIFVSLMYVSCMCIQPVICSVDIFLFTFFFVHMLLFQNPRTTCSLFDVLSRQLDFNVDFKI